MTEGKKREYVEGYSSGWKQCLRFISSLGDVSIEKLAQVKKAMEITERAFIPRPYKDSERKLGKDKYSTEVREED